MKIFLIISCLLFGNATAVQADTIPNLPLDRFVEKQQKGKNIDTSLFQNDKVGDLKQKRCQKEKQEYHQLFQEKSQVFQPEKKLFRKEDTSADYTTKKDVPKKASHYGRFVSLAILAGMGLSIVVWWKERYDGKRNKNNG